MLVVKMKNLRKTYGSHIILNDFNLEVEEGEFVAITGSSGSGKSTLLNIIGGIETFDSGEYNLFGKETPDYNSYAGIKLLRYDISYLFQNFALISSRTVRENIEIGLQYSKLKRQEKNNLISEALIKVGLEGYDKRKVFELSGGEQQRVALARIILKPSKLILADEPTGSVALVQHYPKIIPVMLLSRSTRISDMTERQSVRFSSRVRESYMLLKSACNILSTAEKSGGVSSGASSGICCRAAVYIW